MTSTDELLRKQAHHLVELEVPAAVGVDEVKCTLAHVLPPVGSLSLRDRLPVKRRRQELVERDASREVNIGELQQLSHFAVRDCVAGTTKRRSELVHLERTAAVLIRILESLFEDSAELGISIGRIRGKQSECPLLEKAIRSVALQTLNERSLEQVGIARRRRRAIALEPLEPRCAQRLVRRHSSLLIAVQQALDELDCLG
mmetsp:Transcript_6552/g.14926  ORF Transcript_6552/g.14926 Transcript_6552/m.14926 type:complete len:201 (-) Transcript_6552:39-641(-)